MEYFSVAGPRYDIDRFGAALPRSTPRQADILFVVGTRGTGDGGCQALCLLKTPMAAKNQEV
jgi:Ni,Fe-hydrogenase III small subunit